MNLRQRIWAGAAIFTIALGLGGWFRYGTQTPDVHFTLIDGRQTSLTALRGQNVLVAFWSLSCPPCLEEIPDLIRLHETWKNRGLHIVAVAMAYDPPSAVLAYSQDRQLPYDIALDLDGQIAHRLGDVQVLPASVLIAPDGRVIERHTGKIDADKLVHRLRGGSSEQR